MELGKETHALTDKLATPLAKIVETNKVRISALLASDRATQVGHALNKDENVRQVAMFCYPLLPGLLRLVVKEPAFVSFVMHNREKLLAHLASPAQAA